MKRHFALCCLVAGSMLHAEPRPVRVLYVDETGAEQSKSGLLHEVMRDLGREAIYFDYVTGSQHSADLDKNYDVVIKAGEVADVAATKAKVLDALTADRKAGWQAFLDQREPEVREKHPQVANYEKRPEPLTLQKPFSTKGSLERIQVPADCEVKLFASEPEIAKPIAFAWDERGRCWVVETRDYPHGVVDTGVGQDTIKICEDTDGDGKADKFTVFADKLNLPTGIVFANGGIIVSQPPKFIFLKDTNGDDKADVRETIIDCWGIRDTHAQASNLHYGFDNWLYGCVGYSGIEGYVGGKQHKFAMGTYRFKADGSALEFLHQFTNNAWGHSYNDVGDQFGGTANGAPLFFGGIPQSVVPDGVRVMTAKKINVVEECHTITPNYRQVDVFNGYTAAAGSNFIYSDKLPARFQGRAMVCEPTMKVVSTFQVVDDGAGWKALDGYNIFASSDEWTSPVHAEVGPDGAVWVADFQNFIIQHNPTPSMERGGFVAVTGPGGAHENEIRDHSRGRIYRIWGKATPPAMNAKTVYGALTAQRLAVEKSTATDQLDPIHKLWADHGQGKLTAEAHRAALLSPDAKLRRNAIRALGTDKAAHDLFFGSGVFSDADLHVRLAAFVKLAEFPTTPEIQTLVKKLAADPVVKNDEWLTEAARLLTKKHKVQAFKEGPNLLVNGDLEQVKDGLPVGWTRRDYGSKKPGNAGAEWKEVHGDGQAHGGKFAVRCITRDDADTSLFQDVTLKPNTTYRLSAWVKTHAFKGKISLNDHIGRVETNKITARESGWSEVEVIFTNKDKPKASINLLHVAKGDGYFDDAKLCEVIPLDEDTEKPLAGDMKRGENLFWNHPVAACKNCHVLKGQGSAVGPALDGVATRNDEAYITESLLNPNAKLAKGFEKLGISPMPPMGLILKPQEVADVKAFILSLK
jgi:putative membrane-bound dehydrogenase-like protein